MGTKPNPPIQPNPGDPSPFPEPPQPTPAGEPAEDEKLVCDGCGEEASELFDDGGMNMLCKACAELP